MTIAGTLALSCATVTIGLTMISATPAISVSSQRTGGIRVETAELLDEPIRVHLYQPKTCQPERLLILLPGFERNAGSSVRRARKLAKSACFAVIVPELDQERFPRRRYQRAGITGKKLGKDPNGCTGHLLRQVLDWGREHLGMPGAPYYVFGHSAGAQLLSRVSAFCSLPRPERIIIANPSSYVAASLTERLPFGFGGILDVSLRERLLRDYLAQPITIYVGEQDVGSEQLDGSARAMRQGPTRVQRGRNVFRDAKHYAQLRGLEFNWRLIVAAGVGHTSRGMLRAPEVVDAFGLRQILPTPSGRSEP